MIWRLVLYKSGAEGCEKNRHAGLKVESSRLLALLAEDPFKNPPSYEKLAGDLSDAYSCRINIQHHLIHEVLEEEKIIKVLRM